MITKARTVPAAALALCSAAGAPGAAAQSRTGELSAELHAGTAWSLPAPLVVRFPGEPPLRRRVRYETRPFADAPYYAYRVGWARRGRALEAELLHHKLYLPDPTPPIERFEVTHGYNLPMLLARAPAGAFQVRVGLGVVVAHAEGRIAGREVGRDPRRRRTWLGGGYHIAGPAAQLSVARRYFLGRGRVAAFAAPELKLTAARARVPVGDGTATIPNVAVHVLGGLGVVRRW